MKKLLKSLFFLMFIAANAMAQDRTITGTVTSSEDKLPIPGVSVKILGATGGTSTDANGKYAIKVTSDAKTLEFSSIGFASQPKPIGSADVINVVLSPDSKILGEVVVTALGIQRKRNEVAYAAQTLDGASVSENRSPNIGSSLSGKVSGLEIRQNNTMGGSTNIVVRGVKSITGNNQALFVIDGVPVANNNMNTAGQASGGGGYDYGNPASDINPDDVENITVLKGAAASALYGSRGSNGVILITTKKGKSGLNITVNAGVNYSVIDKTTFPKYQKQYGGGYGPYYGPNGDAYFNSSDINGDGTPDLVAPLTEDASYGGKFDPNLLVYQWDAFDPSSPNYRKARPWVAAANDPTTFFERPVSNNQSIMLTNSYDKGSIKLGFNRDDQNGILPNSRIQKNVFNFGATYNITDKLTAGADVNYFNVDGKGRYGTGYNGNGVYNPATNFRQWWQTNVDVKELEQAYQRTGKNITWNWSDLTGSKPIYWDNPYFARYENYETDTRNRYLGNVNLNYKVTSWLNLLGRYSMDTYNQIQEERQAIGSLDVPFYSKYLEDYKESNVDFLANFDKDISKDLNFKGLLGLNIRKQRTQSTYAITNGGLGIPGIYSLSNSSNPIEAPVELDQNREVHGLFGGASFTYKNMLTVDATIRRDVSSTLPKANNAYYYPSVSLGYTFSEMLKDYKWLSYGKLRANYAEVGSDAPVYSLLDTYSLITPINGRAQTGVPTTKNNPNLKPEKTKSKEVGLEASFLNNRVGIDFTYYNTKTVNQIIPVSLSTSTGYNSQYLNSGSVINQGVELSLNGTPFKTSDFEWKINVNWTKNSNKVTELFKDATGNEAQNLLIQSFQGGVSVNATLDQPYGTIRGKNFVYLNGEKVVLANGRYAQSETSNEVIGNMNPKWIGGINNSFRYKDFNLSFLIDMRHGGSVFSLDQYYGLATGGYVETAGLNDLGNPSRNEISQGGGIINPGVKADGTPNTTRVTNAEYGSYGYRRLPAAAFVYDASFIKLREVVLGYSLPKTLVSKFGPVKGVDLSLIGRNLWIIHKNLPNADPEDGLSFGNVQGYQVGSYPSVRSFAFNLKVRF
ncbi:SusC/RagA family TonB-linked outer membrane protein [Pedobacter sp. AJM]|jgi:TonB-linked SusC/RagA family outer membrane protein|uniref:SusC/RagA family TonB-linked outer membrane protein n=1 Tax=Pedobacter sp. AJM TaxID=2003629 RepID=UPI000B4A8980|nr:SusC/RagA family TonB-linked outer membrane protein [Pedobacter sp. AJM]OWK71453.1 SusC/RagA family protein [Pedobacter sp. AJM]